MPDKPKMPSFTRYKFHRLGGDTDWVGEFTGDELDRELKQRTSTDSNSKWQIENREDDGPGPLRPRLEAIEKLESQIKNDEVGALYFLRNEKGSIEWAIRKVHIKPEVMKTAGTPPLDVAHTALVEFGKSKGIDWQSWGITSKRNVAGTTTKSQHYFSNAEDIHAKTIREMQELADFLVKNAAKLNVHTVIFNRRIWTKADGWHAYTGEHPHTDHVHYDMDPQKG